MADTFYTIELVDNVSKGASRIDKRLKTLDKTARRAKLSASQTSEAYKRFTASTRSLANEQSRAERALRDTGRAMDALNSKSLRSAGGGVGGGRGGSRFGRGGDFRDSLRFANTLSRASSGLDRFRRGITTLFATPIVEAGDYGRTIAEVSTLTNEATFSTLAIRKATQDAARLYGGDVKKQSKALYDLISAGASEAADATNRLDVANRLAVGGVTDVATAVKPLVAAMNAYGLEAAQAIKVSDTLFATVKAGITTIPELSSSMGRVTSTAANMGVSLQEVGGFIAALTAKGISTAEAVTQLNSILSAFQKPADASAKLAKELGFDLSATAFHTKTLTESLKDFDARARKQRGADGFTELVGKMFRNVRATRGVVAAAADDFAGLDKALKITTSDANFTAQAFGKIAKQDFFKIELAKSAFQELKVAAGDAALPALTALTDELRTGALPAFSRFTKENEGLVRALGPLGLTAIIGSAIFAPLLLSGAAAITMFSTLAGLVGGTAALLTGLAGAAAGLGGFFGGRALAESYLETDIGKSESRALGRGLNALPNFAKEFIGLDTEKIETTDAAKRFLRNPEHGGFEFIEEEVPEMDLFEKIDRLQNSAPSIGAAAGRALSASDTRSSSKIGAVNVNVNVEGSRAPADTANAVAEKLEDVVADLFTRHMEGVGA